MARKKTTTKKTTAKAPATATATPKQAKPKPPTLHQVNLTDDDVTVIWSLSEKAAAQGGAFIDALAALRSKLRPFAEPLIAEARKKAAATAARRQG